jgi:hypothetical protein
VVVYNQDVDGVIAVVVGRHRVLDSSSPAAGRRRA